MPQTVAMTELLTAAQMRAIEDAAIESGNVTGLELMERAGRGVVKAIFEEWPELEKAPQSALVLSGPGNNGGDGFVVARLLKEWGWDVQVFLFGDPEKQPPDARVNYERWAKQGNVSPLSEETWQTEILPIQAAIVIDALFGTGLTRAVQLPFLSSLRACRETGQTYRTVSVDLPTGTCSDSGRVLTPESGSVSTDLIVTFHAEKLGHRLNPDCAEPANIRCVDIGLKGAPRSRVGKKPPPGGEVGGCTAVPPAETVKLITGVPHQIFKPSGHKYSHGHALVFSGGPGKSGAARLAARGALRIGAGLVTIACPQQARSEIAGHITAIMLHTLDGTPGLRELLEDDRINALCLGPGMGLGPDTQALTIEALKSGRKVVLDADALTRFERNPSVLFDLTHKDCVLTPHDGEFKRLFPDIFETLTAPAMTGPAYSKVDATRDAAARAGCTVLFKGPDTVIADASGACAVNASSYDRAAPWLATAGSGDVLAGFITGLLARGLSAKHAAETAAWLHTECALSFGPGLIAEDLPEELPKVLTELFNKG